MLYMLLIISRLASCANITRTAENLLQESLLLGYNKYTRPVIDYHSAVNLSYGSALYQLVAFDAKEETMTTLTWQRLSWTDQIINWDPEEHAGIESLQFGQSQLWVPEILTYNDVGALDPDKFMYVLPLRVDYTGRVSWSVPLSMTTTCTMDVTNFPFDSQQCSILIGSWQYNADEVDIECQDAGFDTYSYNKHPQWELDGWQFQHFNE